MGLVWVLNTTGIDCALDGYWWHQFMKIKEGTDDNFWDAQVKN